MEQQPTKKRTDAIKERLQNYSDMVREFENQNERYVRLVTAMESPKVQSFDTMPGGGTAAGDRMTVNIARKIELEKSLEGDEKAIKEERAQLERLIRKVKKPDERAVIRMKYFDGMGWTDIADALFRKIPDFNKAARLYLDKAYKLHGTALLSLAEAQERQRQPTEPKKKTNARMRHTRAHSGIIRKCLEVIRINRKFTTATWLRYCNIDI